jgi:hypothetical protein
LTSPSLLRRAAPGSDTVRGHAASDDIGGHQYEVARFLDIDELLQIVDPSAFDGYWQRQHPACPRKPHRWLINNTPICRIDLHRPPLFVAQIKVNLAVVTGGAKVDLIGRRVKPRPGFEYRDR